MSPTTRHNCKYFHSTVQTAKDRRQKFHFCRLRFDVRPRNGKLNLPNLSNLTSVRNVPLFDIPITVFRCHNRRVLVLSCSHISQK